MSTPAVSLLSTLPRPAQAIALATEQVHVWHFRVSDQAIRAAELRALLSDDELTAAARFRFERDQVRYVVVRGALRRLLGKYLADNPRRLQFEYGPYGKPELTCDWQDAQLRFNVSHSGDLATVAIARGRAIGIDVEKIRPRSSLERLAERLFSPHDLLAWQALPANDRLTEFYRSWTWKESYLKAIGRGLSGELDGFTIQMAPNGQLQLPAAWSDERESLQWSFAQLTLEANYIGMVAGEGTGWSVQETAFSS